MKRLCVFCGSRVGCRPSYSQAARDLAHETVARGIGLVYGGGRVGLMGVLADAALEAGGEVIGVIPRALSGSEIAHAGLTQLHVVSSMHERKALMSDLADGFVALPGGFGTLDELCEVLTWGQLGIHCKPAGLLNVERFFDPLLEQFALAVRDGFLREAHLRQLCVASSSHELLDAVLDWRPCKDGRTLKVDIR